MELDNGYKPNPRQWDFHRAPHGHKLYGGAMGGGKSRALCEEVHAMCLQFPRIECLIGRENLPELKRTTMRTMLDETLMGEGSSYYSAIVKWYNHTDQVLHYKNGSKIHFIPLSTDPATLEKVKSTQFGVVAIDEATEVKESMVNVLDTRLRQMLPDGPPPYRMLFASNPEPGWVKDRFVARTLEDHLFVPADWRDNAENLPPGYDQRFRFMPEAMRKRYLEGSWDVFEGQIYGDFDPHIHLIPPFEIPPEWPRYRSLDYGYVNPQAVLWFAQDWDGNVFLYDELYERHQVPSWWKMAVAVKSEGQRFKNNFGCPKFFQTESHGKKVADEYNEGENPIHLSQAPVGQSVRIARVMEYLKIDIEHPQPVTGEPGSPRLFFFQGRCPNTITEITEYAWADVEEEKDEVQEVPEKRMNHAMEALERFIAMVYEAQAPVVSPIPTPLDKIYERVKGKNQKRKVY